MNTSKLYFSSGELLRSSSQHEIITFPPSFKARSQQGRERERYSSKNYYVIIIHRDTIPFTDG